MLTALSGKAPPVLRRAFTEWPLVSTPVAKTLTGAGGAAGQRNPSWMEHSCLNREVAGQGRFRMWLISM
jgi:hypothetical protein